MKPDTDWLKEARYGVFMHFLIKDAAALSKVNDFDVQGLAGQLETIGAKYFVITLGQNSGYFLSPNGVYDKVTGYAAGERCSRRDLPLDLYHALAPRGIKLMLYLPCQTPNEDPRAQKAFALPEGKKDQPIDLAFAGKWSQVIQEWADRYGDKVAGWWFDGAFGRVKFAPAIAQVYSAAVRHGNPHGLAAYNPGVMVADGHNAVIRYDDADDYTAGELNDPFAALPSSRWLGGAQWHALTFIGSTWGDRSVRHPDERWTAWVSAVAAHGGAVTLDMGPNWDPTAGPIGSLAEAQMKQVKAIQAALARL